MPSQRSLAVFVALSSIVAAAGCAGPTTDVPSDRVAVSASPSTAKTGDLIYVRNMQQGAIVAIDGDTGAEVARYLSGALTPDGALVYGTTFDRGDAVVRVTDIARNITANERRIEGSGLAYELPALSFTGEVGGFSPNARWLVLTTPRSHLSSSATTGQSAFVVLDAKLQQPAKFVELPGGYSFDAISDSGQFLYLEEQVVQNADGGYRVRVYDLNARQLLPGIVVDKTVAGAAMTGTRAGSIASPDGQWQFTLYWRQGGNPFIHAIKLEERCSLCLFLPVQTGGEEDFAWSFVASPYGGTAYAINSLKGYVASIDLATATVLRTATFNARAAEQPNVLEQIARFFVPVAEAKSEMFSIGVVSPDGTTLYATADYGRKLLAIDAATLAVKARFAMDAPDAGPIQLTALGVSPDGARLYALDAAGRSLVRIDAASGRITQLVAVGGPIGGRILRVVTR
jgi:hypothetical protein